MSFKIKRLDHHGIVAGIIDDLQIVPLLDKHLPQDEKQEITPGEAVKGMIMNGLGFANRPLSLSPQFFTNLPLEHLFREGVEASFFNRHKLGRTLDQCFNFGCESLFSLISDQACQIEEVNCQFKSLDTTSHSLTGEYAVDEEGCDENIIRITHGHSKAHRPDLKQVVQEMIVSQDGGIPLACKNWDGNSADTAVFKARSKALVESFKNSKAPSYLIADCKLYHKGNAEFLSKLQFITLIPSTIKLEKELISSKLAENKWQVIDDNYQYSVEQVNHMDINQRWIIIHSKAAQGRAKKSVIKQVSRAKNVLDKSLFHLQAQRFACEHDAEKALNAINKKSNYHNVNVLALSEHKIYEGKGRPKKGAKAKSIEWQITGQYVENTEAIQYAEDQKSCFILATNIADSALSPEDVLHHYKAQSAVERGFRFLKDPLFFVSSLFIKKPSRIDALLMIMTLSLLVYSIAQRRMRATMKKVKASIPNQINQATETPTLRWVFQCFEGINLIYQSENDVNTRVYIEGLDELRSKITILIGGHAESLYKIE
ncbi:IS1634 family transposase, partial [Psychromonas sp. Urea-02u-13]|uniref:IS1634 family transposase n=1 Tax=Psychromonas sp. Urea-02u-13 TaxID=2058326 RepID=UPI000C33206D